MMQVAKIPGQEASDGAEARGGRRQRVLKAAAAAFNLEFSSIPCVVRNISDTGARLEFPAGAAVPAHFVLHFEIDGYKIECERVWQKGNLCGVRFVSERKATRAFRHQVLSTSENALSENFKRDLAGRENHLREQAEREEAARKAAAEAAASSRSVFGKRVG